MNVNSPNTKIVHVIAIFSSSVWCSPLRVHWLQEKFCMEMWRRRSVPLVVLSLYLNFFLLLVFFFYLKAKRSAFVCVAASPRRYPTLRVWGFGGKVLVGFLGCADCDVLNARSRLEWRAVLCSRCFCRACTGDLCEMYQVMRGDPIERAGFGLTGLSHE